MTNYRRQHQELARLAQDAARRHRHQLGNWIYHKTAGRVLGRALCSVCSRHAQIDTQPEPNGRDLFGEAIDHACDPEAVSL